MELSRMTQRNSRKRRSTEDAHGRGARGFSSHGDVIRIATEGSDIVPDPFQRLDLIQKIVVSGRAVFGFRGKFVQSKKSECAQTASYIDDDDAVPR